jgi:hypothetical protein
MRFWEGYSVLNLPAATKDAGWMVVMILICIVTFAVSSIFAARDRLR